MKSISESVSDVKNTKVAEETTTLQYGISISGANWNSSMCHITSVWHEILNMLLHVESRAYQTITSTTIVRVIALIGNSFHILSEVKQLHLLKYTEERKQASRLIARGNE